MKRQADLLRIRFQATILAKRYQRYVVWDRASTPISSEAASPRPGARPPTNLLGGSPTDSGVVGTELDSPQSPSGHRADIHEESEILTYRPIESSWRWLSLWVSSAPAYIWLNVRFDSDTDMDFPLRDEGEQSVALSISEDEP